LNLSLKRQIYGKIGEGGFKWQIAFSFI